MICIIYTYIIWFEYVIISWRRQVRPGRRSPPGGWARPGASPTRSMCGFDYDLANYKFRKTTQLDFVWSIHCQRAFDYDFTNYKFRTTTFSVEIQPCQRGSIQGHFRNSSFVVEVTVGEILVKFPYETYMIWLLYIILHYTTSYDIIIIIIIIIIKSPYERSTWGPRRSWRARRRWRLVVTILIIVCLMLMIVSVTLLLL